MEVLAIIILLSIVTAIILGIIINVKEQYSSQKDDYDVLTDTSYVFKVVTKDARKITGRKSTSTVNKVSEYVFYLDNGSSVKYEHDNNTHILKRGSMLISTNIKGFEVDKSKIKLTTVNEEFATTIYFRNNIEIKD